MGHLRSVPRQSREIDDTKIMNNHKSPTNVSNNEIKQSTLTSRIIRLGMTIFEKISVSVPSPSNNPLCINFPIKLLKNRMLIVASESCLAKGVTFMSKLHTREVNLGRKGMNGSSSLFEYRLRFCTTATCTLSIGPVVNQENSFRRQHV